MSEQFSKMELKALARFLRKVYPGVTDQDDLWELIEKVDRLSKGKHARPDRWRGDSSSRS
jgi:hypothetical protein